NQWVGGEVSAIQSAPFCSLFGLVGSPIFVFAPIPTRLSKSTSPDKYSKRKYHPCLFCNRNQLMSITTLTNLPQKQITQSPYQKHHQKNNNKNRHPLKQRATKKNNQPRSIHFRKSSTSPETYPDKNKPSDDENLFPSFSEAIFSTFFALIWPATAPPAAAKEL